MTAIRVRLICRAVVVIADPTLRSVVTLRCRIVGAIAMKVTALATAPRRAVTGFTADRGEVII